MKKNVQVLSSISYLTDPSEKSHLPTILVLLVLLDRHDHRINIPV